MILACSAEVRRRCYVLPPSVHGVCTAYARRVHGICTACAPACAPACARHVHWHVHGMCTGMCTAYALACALARQVSASLLPRGALRSLLGAVDYDEFRVTLSEPVPEDDVRHDPRLLCPPLLPDPQPEAQPEAQSDAQPKAQPEAQPDAQPEAGAARPLTVPHLHKRPHVGRHRPDRRGRLQPYVPWAATICDLGCNHMRHRSPRPRAAPIKPSALASTSSRSSPPTTRRARGRTSVSGPYLIERRCTAPTSYQVSDPSLLWRRAAHHRDAPLDAPPLLAVGAHIDAAAAPAPQPPRRPACRGRLHQRLRPRGRAACWGRPPW